MHIAFLTPEYPHAKVNASAGIGTSIYNLATGLVSENIRVSIFVYGQKESAILDDNGISIHLIAHKAYPFLGWYLHRKHIASYINSVISSEGINIVEAADWTGITAFTKLKSKLLIRLHGTDAYFCKLDGRKQKKKNYFFEANALKGADRIVSVSDFTAAKTKEIFGLKSKITTIYNGIDSNKFKPSGMEVIPNSILYFGSVIRKKGILELAKAFNLIAKRNPDAGLTVIGRDTIDVFEGTSTLEMVKSIVDTDIQSRVSYKNHMPYNEVIKEIGKSAVIVLPSFAEAFPMTWLEAMAMEKAMVTSNIGWAKELMIDKETGLTVNPNSINELADAILRILESPEKAQFYGLNARKRIVENFSSNDIVKKNIEFYNSLL